MTLTRLQYLSTFCFLFPTTTILFHFLPSYPRTRCGLSFPLKVQHSLSFSSEPPSVMPNWPIQGELSWKMPRRLAKHQADDVPRRKGMWVGWLVGCWSSGISCLLWDFFIVPRSRRTSTERNERTPRRRRKSLLAVAVVTDSLPSLFSLSSTSQVPFGPSRNGPWVDVVVVEALTWPKTSFPEPHSVVLDSRVVGRNDAENGIGSESLAKSRCGSFLNWETVGSGMLDFVLVGLSFCSLGLFGGCWRGVSRAVKIFGAVVTTIFYYWGHGNTERKKERTSELGNGKKRLLLPSWKLFSEGPRRSIHSSRNLTTKTPRLIPASSNISPLMTWNSNFPWFWKARSSTLKISRFSAQFVRKLKRPKISRFLKESKETMIKRGIKTTNTIQIRWLL